MTGLMMSSVSGHHGNYVFLVVVSCCLFFVVNLTSKDSEKHQYRNVDMVQLKLVIRQKMLHNLIYPLQYRFVGLASLSGIVFSIISW